MVPGGLASCVVPGVPFYVHEERLLGSPENQIFGKIFFF